MTVKTKIFMVTAAVAAAVVICVGIFSPGFFTGSEDDSSGNRTFFGGMFRSAGAGYAGAGPESAAGNAGSENNEINAPVTGPGAQNGMLGGSYGVKNGAPGSAGTSGDSGGGSSPAHGSPGENAGGGAGGPDGIADNGSGGGGPDGIADSGLGGGGTGRSGGNTSGGAGDGNTSGSTGLSVTLSIDAETYRPGYVIMSSRTVSFREGESVFDILYRECRAGKIHMSSRWTPGYNSYYIEGIDNLYEYDAGELSGWMYSVNDWFPNYGSSSYKLEDGDVIAWRFTLDLGRDIGGGYATGR